MVCQMPLQYSRRNTITFVYQYFYTQKYSSYHLKLEIHGLCKYQRTEKKFRPVYRVSRDLGAFRRELKSSTDKHGETNREMGKVKNGNKSETVF